MSSRSGNSTARILKASLVGTAIRIFDFYSCATAATLQLLATFALAFFARPFVKNNRGGIVGPLCSWINPLIT